MRYEPYEYELAAIPTMDDEELMDFFLTRIYETEEIWGIREANSQWMTYDRNGNETMPVFPYRMFAENACAGDWDSMAPASESLEYFMEDTLPELIQDEIIIEIMPGIKDRNSLVITSQQLSGILENMLDSGTYTLDG